MEHFWAYDDEKRTLIRVAAERIAFDHPHAPRGKQMVHRTKDHHSSWRYLYVGSTREEVADLVNATFLEKIAELEGEIEKVRNRMFSLDEK